jgi:hypothetical protein
MEYKDCCEFQNLPSGQYVFKVRTKFAKLQGHTAVYSFSRSSSLGIGLPSRFFYLIIGIVLARIIDKAYRSYYQERRQVNPGKQSFTGN